MTDDDPTIVRQMKAALKPRGEDRRAPEPMGVMDYMKFLPLFAAVVAGAIGYGALQTRVAHLEKSEEKEQAETAEARKELRDWNIKLGERLREHKDNQH